MKIKGSLVDIHNREIYSAGILIENGRIVKIERIEGVFSNYILPGFIDSHVHIESSMMSPGEFARIAVTHGTIGSVSDPHEISNVLGSKGVEFMIADGKKVPFYFWFGAPSCVPATSYESSGGIIGSSEIEELLKRKDIKYLSEMMNFPGVISEDREVMKKLSLAKKYGKPVDGHAPGLRGDQLKKYINAGICTDHECSSLEEALEKIGSGMKILIREGSAARNLAALKSLIKTHPGMVMLCSDDIHPEMLIKRHIDKIAASLIKDGFDLFDVLRSCSYNPVMHYGLEAGLLREGDPADFIMVSDLESMNVSETWIKGEKSYDGKNTLFSYDKGEAVNHFNCSKIDVNSIRVMREAEKIRVIEISDGELLTGSIVAGAGNEDYVNSNVAEDILKIVVKDRYNDGPPAVGFIKGFNLKRGAFGSSVAHDSHNIICVGADDKDIVRCINNIVDMKGGLSVCSPDEEASLQLRIGGIMSDSSCQDVARQYEDLSEKVKNIGCNLTAPFMTLSFMALLVIPSLKLSDRGLFDGNSFSFTSLFV